tara:strand:- start:150 stop:350 length:201 start_codon:yes stop_codon:yes gene_type:complete
MNKNKHNQNYKGFDIHVEKDMFDDIRVYANQTVGDYIFQQVSLSNKQKDILEAVEFVKRLIRTALK